MLKRSRPNEDRAALGAPPRPASAHAVEMPLESKARHRGPLPSRGATVVRAGGVPDARQPDRRLASQPGWRLRAVGRGSSVDG